MPRRPDQILTAAIRTTEEFARVLARRPRGFTVWTTARFCISNFVAGQLQTRRLRYVPFPVLSLHEEHVQNVRESKRSNIFVSFHSNYSHFSMSWFYHATHTQGWAIHAVTSSPNPLTLRAYERVFTSVIHTSDIRKAVRALQRGEAIVLLQDAFAQNGYALKLYDRMTSFQLGGARIAKIADSLILPYTALSRGGKGAIHWWPPIDPREGNVEQRLADAMATMIHTYPRSWNRLARFILESEPG